MESQNPSQRMDNGPDNVPPNMHPTAYFYPDQETQYGMRYQPQLGTYTVPGVDLQSPFHHHQNLGIVPPQQYHYTSSPAPAQHSLSASPPPPSPEMYDPLSPPLSGSDASADAFYHHSNSSAGSRPGSRSNSLVHRTNTRYHPTTPSPTSSSGRPRRGRSRDSDDDDMGMQSPDLLAHNRKEATRRQRIEAEQRRRDELRDGYAKLKDVLPVSNLKSSKVSLLERATNYIVEVERTNHELRERLQSLQEEVSRLRALNEKISFVSTEHGATSSPGRFETRPISPPPDGPPAATTRRSQEPVTSTPTPSEHGV